MCGFGTCLLPDMVVSCLASVLRIRPSREVCLFWEVLRWVSSLCSRSAPAAYKPSVAIPTKLRVRAPRSKHATPTITSNHAETWRMRRHQARREPLRSVGKLPHDGKVRSQRVLPACEMVVRVASVPSSSGRVCDPFSDAHRDLRPTIRHRASQEADLDCLGLRCDGQSPGIQCCVDLCNASPMHLYTF